MKQLVTSSDGHSGGKEKRDIEKRIRRYDSYFPRFYRSANCSACFSVYVTATSHQATKTIILSNLSGHIRIRPTCHMYIVEMLINAEIANALTSEVAIIAVNNQLYRVRLGGHRLPRSSPAIQYVIDYTKIEPAGGSNHERGCCCSNQRIDVHLKLNGGKRPPRCQCLTTSFAAVANSRQHTYYRRWPVLPSTPQTHHHSHCDACRAARKNPFHWVLRSATDCETWWQLGYTVFLFIALLY